MRRRFGSPFRRQPPDRPGIPPALQRAHELLESGEYPAAALAFEQLAHGAEARQGPRAPFLFLQAGRARLLQNENQAALTHFTHGLELLKRSGRLGQFQRAGRQISQELAMRGLEAESRAVTALLGADSAASPRPVGTASLPTHCPACGGPLRPTEVEWLDGLTAECPYCGSPLRGKGFGE